MNAYITFIKKYTYKWVNKYILYTLGAQPYDFEPHWLISDIFVAHFHF